MLRNFVFSLLSRDWAGLVLAAPVALLGWWSIHLGRVIGPIWIAWLGYLLLAIAVLMAIGSTYHLIHMVRVHAKYPPPGRLVDIGGYRLHLLAEGEAGKNPAVVWMPGSHGAGFSLYHLHKVLRESTRSILIDRPGTGWSDTGPFPRSTAREAVEVVAALEKSGEKGPFVFVGHSFGGLLVANIARRYPEIVAGVVLLDPTPPDTIVYGPRIARASLAQMRKDAAKSAFLCLFGIYPDAERRLAARNPDVKRLLEIIEKQLGSASETTRTLGFGARSAWTNVSIFKELSAQGLAERGWETAVYDGDLGDLAVFLVAPRTDKKDLASMPEVAASPNAKRMIDLFSRMRERYLAVSSKSQRIFAPEGTGHNFPYEAPVFVIDVIRKLLPFQ